jgi:DNA-binding transcriptional regulator/RsmH inhibitor MraZ
VTYPFPTQRLSGKHQLTVPRGSRGLEDGHGEAVTTVFGMLRRFRSVGGEQQWPALMLMTEQRLREIEQEIHAREGLHPAQRQRLIQRISGESRQMGLDGQHRVVLPKHVVDQLELGRDVYCYSTNQEVMVWNPDHYQAYMAGSDEEDIDAFL